MTGATPVQDPHQPGTEAVRVRAAGLRTAGCRPRHCGVELINAILAEQQAIPSSSGHRSTSTRHIHAISPIDRCANGL